MQLTLWEISHEICPISSSLCDAITFSAQGNPGSLQNIQALDLIQPLAIFQHIILHSCFWERHTFLY